MARELLAALSAYRSGIRQGDGGELREASLRP